MEAGADEIDIVITRAHVFGGKWQALYDEIAAFKQACGPAHMKVILGTGTCSHCAMSAAPAWSR